MNNTPTPHNSAIKGDFAETCIICGDPMRSKYIAEKFLTNAKLINNVRGIQGYTGEYKGHKLSVMAHGMGMPSLCIYVYELFNFYGVENIIRIGTAGTISDNADLGDVVIAKSAITPSNIVESFGYNKNDIFYANAKLADAFINMANQQHIKTNSGLVVSSDVFYDSKTNLQNYASLGAVAVEMEIAMLYALANKYNKNAMAVLNITDKPLIGVGLTSEERITLMDRLIVLTLDVAITTKG